MLSGGGRAAHSSSCLLVAITFIHRKKFTGLCSAKSGLYYLDLVVVMMSAR
jgi:hypothetical protein